MRRALWSVLAGIKGHFPFNEFTLRRQAVEIEEIGYADDCFRF